MRHTTFLPEEGTDYEAIAKSASEPDVTEIGPNEYDYALSVLPPRWLRSAAHPTQFVIIEATTSTPRGPVHSAYCKIGGKFYAKYVIVGVPETYITYDAALHPANPLIEADDAKYADDY